ncbi:MAG: hypothetical protein RLZZ241_395 [Bacteroidota bacterium]|jgi:shikimate dehydrogenase
MEKSNDAHYRFGLLGKNIGYSFSRGYFSEKFDSLGLSRHSYENFDLEAIDKCSEIFEQDYLIGLNVTIPYKEAVIPFLQALDKEAQEIGAVNTICLTPNGTKGYNTDLIGFRESLRPLLKAHDKKALILGTGGASKAVAYALNQLDLSFTYVSRSLKLNQLTYNDLNSEILSEYSVIVQCSPVGTYPNIEEAPNLPYAAIGPNHLLYDLIYNPETTAFLRRGLERGARIKNGLEMLQIQAEAAWKLWNNTNPTY